MAHRPQGSSFPYPVTPSPPHSVTPALRHSSIESQHAALRSLRNLCGSCVSFTGASLARVDDDVFSPRRSNGLVSYIIVLVPFCLNVNASFIEN